MNVFNLNGDEWDEVEDRPGWRKKEAFVGGRIDAELIGGSMSELEPGDRLWPYHTHHANEEWMIVLRGRPTLRTPHGEQELVEGDVACFLPGQAGLHQVRNYTDTPIRVLMLSTRLAPDILEYPDSGKHVALDATGEGLFCARLGPNVEYWDGEK